MIKRYRLYASELKPGYKEKRREKLSHVLEIDDDIEFNWTDHRGRKIVKDKLSEFLEKDKHKIEEMQVMDPETGETVEFLGSELDLLMRDA